MYLEYLNRYALLALDANSIAAAYSDPPNLTAAPAQGTGYRLFSLTSNPGVVPSRLRIFPIGVGSNNDAFAVRVWALYRYVSSGTYFYFQAPILEFTATLGTRTGIAGGLLTTTTRYADTIALTAAPVGEPTTTANTTNAGTSTTYSPANDTAAWVEIDTRGALGHYFDFKQSVNTPTMNALILHQN